MWLSSVQSWSKTQNKAKQSCFGGTEFLNIKWQVFINTLEITDFPNFVDVTSAGCKVRTTKTGAEVVTKLKILLWGCSPTPQCWFGTLEIKLRNERTVLHRCKKWKTGGMVRCHQTGRWELLHWGPVLCLLLAACHWSQCTDCKSHGVCFHVSYPLVEWETHTIVKIQIIGHADERD